MKINKLILLLFGLLLASGGYLYYQNETLVSKEIYEALNISTPTPIPSKPIENVLGETTRKEQTVNNHPICNSTKQEVLNDAFSEDVTDVNELKKLSALYDLLCFGKTDVDISEAEQKESITGNWEQYLTGKCRKEQEEYNSCLIKYNTELLEWQNCQAGKQTFGCPLSSMHPINTCGTNISSLCKNQILGTF